MERFVSCWYNVTGNSLFLVGIRIMATDNFLLVSVPENGSFLDGIQFLTSLLLLLFVFYCWFCFLDSLFLCLFCCFGFWFVCCCCSGGRGPGGYMVP